MNNFTRVGATLKYYKSPRFPVMLCSSLCNWRPVTATHPPCWWLQQNVSVSGLNEMMYICFISRFKHRNWQNADFLDFKFIEKKSCIRATLWPLVHV